MHFNVVLGLQYCSIEERSSRRFHRVWLGASRVHFRRGGRNRVLFAALEIRVSAEFDSMLTFVGL